MTDILFIEKGLSPSERALFRTRYDSARKDPTTAVLLGVFLGVFGAHRFYLGQIGLGIVNLLVGGILLVIPVIQILFILAILFEILTQVRDRVDEYNVELAQGIAAEIMHLSERDLPLPRTGSDDLDQLERLAKLRDGGHLSPEEFAEKKRQILGGS